MENQWAYPRALHGVFGHPHHIGTGEELTPIEFTLQHTDYKSVGAYRKFSGDNASNPKLRADANLRYLYEGPKRPGPGRPKTYDGKVRWTDLSRFALLGTDDEHIVLYHQVVHHVQFRCPLRVVLVVDTARNRRAVLFSTDVGLNRATQHWHTGSTRKRAVSVER